MNDTQRANGDTTRDERSILVPSVKTFPRPFPWPWGCYPTEPTSERDVFSSRDNILEVLQVLYVRPDMRASIKELTAAFADLLANDPTAAQSFAELLKGVPAKEDERLAPVIAYLLIAAAGAALGYLSRPR
jgi:hypothetical protein